MKTMQEKRKDALYRLEKRQRETLEKLAELTKGRKDMEGQRGITAEIKSRRDEHIDSVKKDVARRDYEIQRLKIVISQHSAY